MDPLEMETKWQWLEILKSQSTQQNLNSPVFLANLHMLVDFVLFLMRQARSHRKSFVWEISSARMLFPQIPHGQPQLLKSRFR